MDEIIYLHTPRKRPLSPTYSAAAILNGRYPGGLKAYRKDTWAHEIYVTWFESLTGKISKGRKS